MAFSAIFRAFCAFSCSSFSLRFHTAQPPSHPALMARTLLMILPSGGPTPAFVLRAGPVRLLTSLRSAPGTVIKVARRTALRVLRRDADIVPSAWPSSYASLATSWVSDAYLMRAISTV